jgi:WD40 repeat protein
VGPLKGHRAYVGSVMLAPWLCQDHTGQAIVGLFEGHSGSVNSIAFSPDGIRVASGSSDKTLRIWDAQTSQVITSPFRHDIGWWCMHS